MSRAHREAEGEPGALELVEEAFNLLREAPAATLAVYFAGTVPFVLGFLFFWAYMTWFAPPPEANAWAACGLTLLFAAMKGAHSEFCGRLMAQRTGAAPPPVSCAGFARLACVQLRVHAWGLIALPIAFAAQIPFGWAYAYYQNATVLGGSRDVSSGALKQAWLWPVQNHFGLLILLGVATVAWTNIAAAFWGAPWMASHFLGIDNLFGFTGPWFLNSTFLAVVTVLAWIAIDPLAKAFYTLRVFYGRSRRTGEDLHVDLGAVAAPFGRAARVAAAAVLCVSLGVSSARAAGARPGQESADPRQLDASIDEVLSGRDFQWRLRPPAQTASARSEGPLEHFLHMGYDMIVIMVKGVLRFLGKIVDWLGQFLSGGSSGASPSGSAAGGIIELLVYVLGAAALILAIALVVIAISKGVRAAKTQVEARKVEPVAPDLADESSHAGQLATDGWLELARQQLAIGQWRLAWRALYLATLARLAAEGLVTLAKFKTNGDYEGEVRRRSMDRGELCKAFSSRRGAFEAVWYGSREPNETVAREWLAELERTVPS